MNTREKDNRVYRTILYSGEKLTNSIPIFISDWESRTISRLHLAIKYRQKDPESALVKYRLIAEDCLRTIYQITEGKEPEELSGIEGYKGKLTGKKQDKLNAQQKKHIEIFSNALSKGNQGAHHWPDPTTLIDVDSAMNSTISFLNWIQKFLRDNSLNYGVRGSSFNLVFCPEPNCRAPTISLSFGDHVEYMYDSEDCDVFGCIYCECLYLDQTDKEKENRIGSKVGVYCPSCEQVANRGPDILFHLNCDACGHRTNISDYDFNLHNQFIEFISEDPIAHIVHGTNIITDLVPCQSEEETSILDYLQLLRDHAMGYPIIKSILRGIN